MLNLHLENWIASFDFDPLGETTASIDRNGICLLADVNTGNCLYAMEMDSELGKKVAFLNILSLGSA